MFPSTERDRRTNWRFDAESYSVSISCPNFDSPLTRVEWVCSTSCCEQHRHPKAGYGHWQRTRSGAKHVRVRHRCAELGQEFYQRATKALKYENIVQSMDMRTRKQLQVDRDARWREAPSSDSGRRPGRKTESVAYL